MNSILSTPLALKNGNDDIENYDISIDNNNDVRTERLLLGLTRRIEHSELDINYLKGILYGLDEKIVNTIERTVTNTNTNTNTNSYSSSPNNSPSNSFYRNNHDNANNNDNNITTENKIKYLKGEVEGLRLLVKRIEVHQANDLLLFNRVKELVKNMKLLNSIKLDVDVYNANRESSNNKMADMAMALDNKLIEFEQKSNDLELKLDTLVKDIHHKLAKLDSDLADNITNCNMNTEKLALLRDEHDSLYRKHVAHVKATIGKSTKGGLAKIKHAFKLRTIGKRNIFFKRWVQYTVSLREKIIQKATKFNKILTVAYNKIDKPYSLSLMLKIWRKAKNRMKSYENHKRMVHYSLKKWTDRVHKQYDLAHYIRIWKRNVVLKRPGLKDIPPPLMAKVFEEIKTDGFGLALVIQKLMIEMQGQNQLFSNQTDQMKIRVNEVDSNLESLEYKIMNIINDKFATLEKENARIERMLKEKFAEVKEAIDVESKRAEARAKVYDARLSTVEDFINNLGNTINNQNNKIEKTMILQGKQITRCDAIEKSQKQFNDEKLKIEEVLYSLNDKFNTEFKDLVSEVSIFKEAVSTQDEVNDKQFREIYQKTYDAYENINKTSDRNSKKVEEVYEAMARAKEKIDQILLRFRKIDPPPPCPNDLLEIYVIFESDMVSQRSGGLLLEEFSDKLSEKFIILVKRIAIMISESVSKKVLANVVSKNGLESGGAEDPIKSTGILRDEEVDSFISGFVKLLQDRDLAQNNAANIIKAKARVVFYRRFMLALGLAFSALGEINIEYPTSLTIKKAGNTNNNTSITNSICLACHRPDGNNSQNDLKKIINDLNSITDFNQIREKYPNIVPTTSKSNTRLVQDIVIGNEDYAIKNAVTKINRPQTAIHQQAFPPLNEGNNQTSDIKIKKQLRLNDGRPKSANSDWHPPLIVNSKKLQSTTKKFELNFESNFESQNYDDRMKEYIIEIDKDELKRKTIEALRSSLKIPLRPQYNKNIHNTNTTTTLDSDLYTRNFDTSLSFDPELPSRMNEHTPNPPSM